MQFGAKHRFASEAPGSLLSRLRDDFEAMRERHALVPDIILITGDLVEFGKPSEFKQFQRFAGALAESFDLPRRRLVMIPGNHDINRAACEAYFKDCEADERAPRRPYWPKLRHYAAMFAEFYASEPDLTFTEEAPYTFFEYPELGVVVAGLNSTIADSHREEDHYGLVGEQQLKHFADKLRGFKDQGYVRIAAVHHDPMNPESEPARRELKDIRRLLVPYTNLVVHGHIHEEQLNWLDNMVPVLGVGSAGVQAAQRPAEVPNQYQWLRMFAGRLEYGSRAYVPDQTRWVGDLRPDRAGEQWWQSKAVAFEKVTVLTAAPGLVVNSPQAERARVVDRYRKAQARQLRRRSLICNMATYGEDIDLVQGLDLLTIFVPQRAVRDTPRSDRPTRLHDPTQDAPGGARSMEDVDPGARTAPLAIDAIVTSPEHPWTLILGTPGAGKTTLTLWLALRLIVADDPVSSLSTDLVPVRVELRLFVERWSAARKSGRPYNFFDYMDDVRHEDSRSLSATVLRGLAEEGLVLWLFDGLDEVAVDEDRRAIANMITDVREQYQGRGVITGRIVGCRPLSPGFHDADIHCFTLLDFEEPQIERFLGQWHTLAFPNAADLGARRLERLRRALADSPALRDLCGNPLLLTLVALLNRGDELPRRRHELLKDAAVLMINKWEANKGPPATDATPFDLGKKHRFLAELAGYMLEEVPGGAGNVIEEDALRRFTERFWARHRDADVARATSTAAALIEHLRARNYVLGLLGGRSFGFLHKAFLEFFAAEEIAHRYRSHAWRLEDVQDLFRKRWEDAAWREVLTLTCGMLQEDRPETVIALVQAALAAAPVADPNAHVKSCSFAVQCLTEVRNLRVGITHEFAVGIGQYLWAAMRRCEVLREQSSTRLYESADRTFASSAGTWPGLADMVSRVLVEARPLSELSDAGLIVFTAGLDPDSRHSLFRELIEGWKIGPDFVRQAVASDIWSMRDTSELEAEIAARSPPHLGAVLALARAAEAQGCVRPPPAVIACLTPAVAAMAAGYFDDASTAANKRDALSFAWRQTLAHLTRAALAVAPLEYIREEALPLIGFNIEFTKDEIAAVSSIADLMDRGRLLQLILFSSHVEEFLHLWLRNADEERADLFVVYEWAANNWPRGAEILVDWTRSLVDHDEGRRLRGIFHFLSTIRGEHPRGLAMGVPFWVSPGGEPDWALLRYLAWPLSQASTEEVLAVLQALPAVFHDRTTEVALYMLSFVVRCGRGGDFADERNGAEFMRFFDLAFEKSPWLALYYSGKLWEARRSWLATIQTSDFSRRLVDTASAGRFQLQESQLLEVAETARSLQLPWEPPLRHLVEHAKDGRLRVLAAWGLGDWATLIRLAREGTPTEQTAAQIVLEIRDLRDHLLHIGRLRKALVLRRGVRVGTLEELAGGASRFSYQHEYLAQPGVRPIAPNLPLRAEPYDSPGLHPVFEGLLPQGWLLDIDLGRYRLKPSDQFGLLLATGRDTIGAIEIIPERD